MHASMIIDYSSPLTVTNLQAHSSGIIMLCYILWMTPMLPDIAVSRIFR